MNHRIIIFLPAIICFTSCADEVAKKDINPNGSSELAVLMRSMFDDGLKVKEAVIAGEDASVNCDYARIHTAKATDPEKVAHPSYASFASAYESSVDAFNAATPFQQKEAYKHMVKSCIDCHTEVCPGPIRKIRKLALPDDVK